MHLPPNATDLAEQLVALVDQRIAGVVGPLVERLLDTESHLADAHDRCQRLEALRCPECGKACLVCRGCRYNPATGEYVSLDDSL